MVKLGNIQKYSKGRYISHNKVIIASDKPYCLPIIKIVSSSKKVGNKFVLTKSSILETEKGKIKIINVPSRGVPVGKFI